MGSCSLSARAGSLPASYCRLVSRAGVEGAAIAVFQNGAAATIGCGKRDRARRLAVTPQTVFPAASLSKPIFAYAALQLVQQGKLDLDAPLLGYLGGSYTHEQEPFSAGSPTDTVRSAQFQRITTRQVLTHTSGLPNWSSHGPLTITGKPGEWQYSTEGYILLQRAVERITGESFEPWIERTVFLPLGMVQSSFVWRPVFRSNAASGFDSKGRPENIRPYSRPLAAATLYTTVDDYSRFLKVLLDRGPIAQLMMESRIVIDRRHRLSWGLGIGIEEGSSPAYFHSGSNRGYRSFFLIEPQQKRGMLVLTNSENGYWLLKPLLAQSLGDAHPVLDAPELPYPKS